MLLANRISPINVGGYSVWDVAFELKQGALVLDEPYLGYLKGILGLPTLPAGFTFEQSFRQLLATFQSHVDNGTTGFAFIDALAFLKLSMSTRDSKTYFTFQAQFWDDPPDEQAYIDDMYERYGKIMEVVWRHCVDVTEVVVNENGPAPYVLAPTFLKLVEQNRVDNTGAITFFVKNPGIPPTTIAVNKRDAERYAAISTAAGDARLQLKAPQPNHRNILLELMARIDAIEQP